MMGGRPKKDPDEFCMDCKFWRAKQACPDRGVCTNDLIKADIWCLDQYYVQKSYETTYDINTHHLFSCNRWERKTQATLLKPCPFCGHTAIYVIEQSGKEGSMERQE